MLLLYTIQMESGIYILHINVNKSTLLYVDKEFRNNA